MKLTVPTNRRVATRQKKKGSPGGRGVDVGNTSNRGKQRGFFQCRGCTEIWPDRSQNQARPGQRGLSWLVTDWIGSVRRQLVWVCTQKQKSIPEMRQQTARGVGKRRPLDFGREHRATGVGWDEMSGSQVAAKEELVGDEGRGIGGREGLAINWG